MPVHIYPNKIYTLYSPELKELITELSREHKYRLEEEEDEEEEVKYIRLVNGNYRITFVFMKVEQKYILHYIEVLAISEKEYESIIGKIKEKIKVYSIGWI